MADAPAFNPADYDNIPDDQLQKMAAPAQSAAPAFNPADYDHISDDQLQKMSNAQQPGFLTRVGADLSKRNDQVNDAVGQFGANSPDALIAGLGKGVAGSANDILGEGAKSMYNSLPDAVTTPINKGATTATNYLMNTDAGKYAAGKAKDAAGAYKDFASQNPRTANALESVGDIAGAAANLVPIGKGVTEVGGPMLDAVAPVLKDFAADETSSAGESVAKGLAQNAKPTAQQIRELGSRSFQRGLNGGNVPVYTPEATQGVLRGIQKEMLEGGKLTDRLHGDSLGTLSDMAQEAQSKGGLDLNDIHGWRQTFGDVINKNLNPDGTLNADAHRAFSAQNAIDDFLYGPGMKPETMLNGDPQNVQDLQNGMKLWSQAARMKDVERIINNSWLRQNPATSMRSGFATLASSDKRMRGFTPQDQFLIRNAAQANLPMEYLRAAGSRLLPIASYASGDVGGLAHGAIEQATGHAARSMAGNAQAARGEKVLDSIRSRIQLPDLNDTPPRSQLGAPPVYGQPPAGPPPPSGPQKLLPRGGSDTYYQPQGRTLTYQPRADFEVTPDGFAQRPSNVAPPAQRPAEGAVMRRAGENAADRNVKRLMITHQPRPDFVGTDNGIVQAPSNRVGAMLGEDQDLPIDAGELDAMRDNPKWPPGNKRGGAINKKKGGAVYARPRSYPALEARRAR